MFPSSILAAQQCSKAILRKDSGHGKSPCFSRYAGLDFADVDGTSSPLTLVSIEVFQV